MYLVHILCVYLLQTSCKIIIRGKGSVKEGKVRLDLFLFIKNHMIINVFSWIFFMPQTVLKVLQIPWPKIIKITILLIQMETTFLIAWWWDTDPSWNSSVTRRYQRLTLISGAYHPSLIHCSSLFLTKVCWLKETK